MKFDTSGIILPDLARHLGEAYGLPIATVEFTPKGEEAYSFIAAESRGERYFVRAQRGDLDGHLEGIYAAIAALQTNCGIAAALAPCRTREGRFSSHFAAFTVALFPFVAGTTAYESGITERQWAVAAKIIAALHMSGGHCAVPILARETFDNPFAAPIERALRRAAADDPPASAYQERVIALLREQEPDVRATFQRMGRMRDTALRLDPPMAPTHGDPNLANFLIDDAGALHLTDWGDLALGPRERDLMFFTGERFGAFLRRYLESAGRARLHRLLFAFYCYRWAMQEIADYTSRILFGEGDPDEEAHTWEELRPYLPIAHTSIEIDLDAIMRVLRPLVDEGFLDVEATL